MGKLAGIEIVEALHLPSCVSKLPLPHHPYQTLESSRSPKNVSPSPRYSRRPVPAQSQPPWGCHTFMVELQP